VLESHIGQNVSGATAVVIDPKQMPKYWSFAEKATPAVGTAQEREDYANIVAESKQLASVPYQDADLDARCFPSAHPYGSGSMRGNLSHYIRHKLYSLDPWCRETPTWVFWQLDRMIKHQLFFIRRRQLGGAEAAKGECAGKGEAKWDCTNTKAVVDSADWWSGHRHDLLAMTEEHELGPPQAMLTLTHSDQSPEMLAAWGG